MEVVDFLLIYPRKQRPCDALKPVKPGRQPPPTSGGCCWISEPCCSAVCGLEPMGLPWVEPIGLPPPPAPWFGPEPCGLEPMGLPYKLEPWPCGLGLGFAEEPTWAIACCIGIIFTDNIVNNPAIRILTVVTVNIGKVVVVFCTLTIIIVYTYL